MFFRGTWCFLLKQNDLLIKKFSLFKYVILFKFIISPLIFDLILSFEAVYLSNYFSGHSNWPLNIYNFMCKQIQRLKEAAYNGTKIYQEPCEKKAWHERLALLWIEKNIHLLKWVNWKSLSMNSLPQRNHFCHWKEPRYLSVDECICPWDKPVFSQ